jgi:hypothetical protein
MTIVPISPRWRSLGPPLCFAVLATMLIAILYAAWISLDNYSNIGV